MRSIRIKIIGLAVGMATLVMAHAELPPSAYEQKQAAAPEKLDIQVMRVEVEPGSNPTDQLIRITALVEDVARTNTGVKKGDFVTIAYQVSERPAGWVGPGQIPILNEKDKTVAYLQRVPDSGDFQPMAGAMSFSDF